MKRENNFSRMLYESKIRQEERKRYNDERFEAEKKLQKIQNQELKRRAIAEEEKIPHIEKDRRKKQSTKVREIAASHRAKKKYLNELARRGISENDPILRAVLLAKTLKIHQNVIFLGA